MITAAILYVLTFPKKIWNLGVRIVKQVKNTLVYLFIPKKKTYSKKKTQVRK